MEWVRENWFFILFAILFIAMHLFGFGCGGHSGHGRHGGDEKGNKHKEHSGEGTPEKEKGSHLCH